MRSITQQKDLFKEETMSDSATKNLQGRLFSSATGFTA